jgi:hypothetical protein
LRRARRGEPEPALPQVLSRARGLACRSGLGETAPSVFVYRAAPR